MVRTQGPRGHGVRWGCRGKERPDLASLVGCVMDFRLCLYFKWGWGSHDHSGFQKGSLWLQLGGEMCAPTWIELSLGRPLLWCGTEEGVLG